MIPSLDDRLDSIVRALQEVILPALAPDRSLAIEQTHLVLAQIGVIREQLDRAPLFERREAEAMIALARALLGTASGGDRTMAATDALRAAVDAAGLDAPGAVRATTCSVGERIEELIAASGSDGSDGFRAASLDLVLSAGITAAMRERSWNRSAGFEAAGSNLPDLDLASP